MDVSENRDSRGFPTTTWGLVARARGDSDFQAVSDLLSRYWKPVFYFVRARKFPLCDAEDLTQAFFEQFLERDWLRRVDPDRGRFRTFMLTLLVRFLSDQTAAHRLRRQESFERAIPSFSSLLTDEDRAYEPAIGESAEDVFSRQWATALVREVQQKLRGEFNADGRLVWYELFETCVLSPNSPAVSKPSVAKEFSMTLDQVRYRVKMVTDRFDQLLRLEVGQQVGSRNEIDQEIQELLNLVADR